MPSRTEHSMISSQENSISRMRAAGLNPKHQILDNEASAKYKAAITNSCMTYQLVPPNNHRRNIAEKAIQLWKYHFIVVLSGMASTFPLRLLCQVIPHAERQLLLIHQSNTNPKISPYAHLYGAHDYSALPFVPIGMETLVHDKLGKRRAWDEHASKVCVLGTSPEHYRCWKIGMYKTHRTRILNTVIFKHKYLNNPTIRLSDAILAAATDMSAQFRGHHTRHFGANQLHDLNNLHTIFADVAATNAANVPTPRTQNSDYCVLASRAGYVVGPNLDDVAAFPLGPRPALTPALPPRVIPLPRTTPLQVSRFSRVERNHLPAQYPNTAPHQRVPTTPTVSRREPPRRSPKPLNAASMAVPLSTTPQRCPTRLAALREKLADRDEQNTSRRARRLLCAQLLPIEQLEGPARHTHSRTCANLTTRFQQQDTQLEEPLTGPAMRTHRKKFSTTQEAMLSCCNIRQH